MIKSARNGRQSSGCGVEQKPNTLTKQRHFVICSRNTHRPEREINPQTFVYERDILAEAQVSLKNAWRTMEADGGQIFY